MALKYSKIVVVSLLTIGLASCSSDTLRFSYDKSKPLQVKEWHPDPTIPNARWSADSKQAAVAISPGGGADIDAKSGATADKNVRTAGQAASVASYHGSNASASNASRSQSSQSGATSKQPSSNAKNTGRSSVNNNSSHASSAAKTSKQLDTSNASKTATATKNSSGTSGSSSQLNYRLPLLGKVIGKFGQVIDGQRVNGLKISAPVGTSVRAANDGIVIYAGNALANYGNIILIQHSANVVTVYAHNSKLLVKRGDKVKRGQIISLTGQTGSVKVPQLYFEIRENAKAVNPQKYINL